MELVGTVTLRNERRVFRSGDCLVIEQVDRNGTKHSNEFEEALVGDLVRELPGGEFGVDEAVPTLLRVGGGRVPFTHGYKLRFFTQDVLVAGVVLGLLTLRKEGRRFLYRRHGA